jgi:protease I
VTPSPRSGTPDHTPTHGVRSSRSNLGDVQLTDVQSGAGALDVRTLVLTADKFEDLELIVPYFRLLEEGGAVDIAAPTLDEISGEHGYRVMPDILITGADPDQYDLLLVPGGFPDGAPATVRDIPEAQAIARSFFTLNKPVAAICHGPWLLAAADVVRGRRLTSYWQDGVPEDVRAAGGEWEDAPVVVDGNLVTSRWPPDIPVFTEAMMRLIRTPPR